MWNERQEEHNFERDGETQTLLDMKWKVFLHEFHYFNLNYM